jgi:hypothetical protein
MSLPVKYMRPLRRLMLNRNAPVLAQLFIVVRLTFSSLAASDAPHLPVSVMLGSLIVMM